MRLEEEAAPDADGEPLTIEAWEVIAEQEASDVTRLPPVEWSDLTDMDGLVLPEEIAVLQAAVESLPEAPVDLPSVPSVICWRCLGHDQGPAAVSRVSGLCPTCTTQGKAVLA